MKTTAPPSEQTASAADDGMVFTPPQDQARAKSFIFKQLYTSRFYFGKGIVLHLLGQREKAIRNFQILLCMNWRDEKAAFWLDRLDDGSKSLQPVNTLVDPAPAPAAGGEQEPEPTSQATK